MKRKLLFVAALAAVLTAVGSVVFLRQVTFTQATPTTMPVQPFAVTTANYLGSTALGAWAESKAESNIPTGARLNSSISFTDRFPATPDKDMVDGTVAAWVTSVTDVLCDGTPDYLLQQDAPYDPYPAVKETTNVDTDGLLGTDPNDYVRFNSPMWSMIARYVVELAGLHLGAPGGPFIALNPPIPVNSISMQVPWNPLSQAGQATLAGNPAPPSGVCDDSPMDTVTTTIARANPPAVANPPLEGDSGGPCTGPTCADAGITGFWPDPGKLTGASVSTVVNERVHNGGPGAGTFKVSWEFEPPAGVSGTWVTVGGDTVVGNALTFTATTGAAGWDTLLQRTLNLTCTPPGSYLVALKNIWYPLGAKDQNLVNNARTSMIQVECGAVTGTPVDKEVVWVKPTDVSNPADEFAGIAVAPFAPGTLTVADAPWVANQWYSDIVTITAGTGQGQERHITANTNNTLTVVPDWAPIPDGTSQFKISDSTPEHLQLVEGETATVTVADMNVFHPDTLVINYGTATGGDATHLFNSAANWTAGLVGDTVLINLGTGAGDQGVIVAVPNATTLQVNAWSFGINPDATSGYEISVPGAIASANGIDTLDAESIDQTKIETTWADATGPDYVQTTTVLEPAGVQQDNTHSLQVSCLSGSAALSQPQPVVIKAIDRPDAGYRETRPGDNVQYRVISVWCFADSTARAAAKDGIDDGTGLYLRWTTFQSSADIRKSGKAGADVGSPADTAYVERMIIPECFWLDANGSPDLTSDGYISAAESQADPDIPGGGYAAIDADGDCMENATYAQPGQPVDSVDTPTGAMCQPLVYSESLIPGGGGTGYIQVQYSTAADQDCDGLPDGVEAGWTSDPTVADTDGDGAGDFLEMFDFTNPGNPDTDYDLLKDKPEDDYVAQPAGGFETNGGSPPVNEAVNADDNCPNKFNPDQANFDGHPIRNGANIPGTVSSNPNADTMGDACDTDIDNDGISNVAELNYATQAPNPPGGGSTCTLNPYNPDTDGDHARDGMEHQLGSNPCVNAATAASLNPAQTVLFRGGGISVPALGAYGGLWDQTNSGDPPYTERREKNADADYSGAPSAAYSVNSKGDAGTDADNDDGSNGNPAEISDVVEVKGFDTNPSRVDTDGDGCADWIEIADVNGDRKANILDVLQVAQSALGGEVTTEPDLGILDINKDRTLNILDVQVEAKNSDLITAKAHSKCASDTER